MSDAIIGRVDEMSSRIDELERSIGDLMVQVSHCCFDARDAAFCARKRLPGVMHMDGSFN